MSPSLCRIPGREKLTSMNYEKLKQTLKAAVPIKEENLISIEGRRNDMEKYMENIPIVS